MHIHTLTHTHKHTHTHKNTHTQYTHILLLNQKITLQGIKLSRGSFIDGSSFRGKKPFSDLIIARIWK